MSSGTQVELDWTGVDAGQGGAAAPAANPTNGAGAGTYQTDEELLGIEPVSAGPARSNGVVPSEARNLSSIDDAGNAETQRGSSGKDRPRFTENVLRERNDVAPVSAAMPAWIQALAGDPKHGAEAQQLWQEHQAFRAAFSSPDEARAIKELFPGGAQEARALRQGTESLREAAQSVDRIDAAIFSGDARAQSEVVAELARANPAAFRSLFAEAAKVLAGLGQSGSDVQRHPATQNQVATPQEAPFANAPGEPDANHPSTSPRAGESQITNHGSRDFDPAAYAAFERSTNDVVARDVRAAVSDTLARVLPEGIADGAARRIGDDIFNEIHRTLAADRSLSEQVGEVLRSSQREFTASGWRFGTAEQQRVASLLAGRAKQLVPGVARRVIGEWTSSVLGASRSKAARQAAAAARVDIAAPGGSLDSMPLRPMSPREVNYASMSDDEILSL
jgi:hypothetical protein